MLDSRRKKYCNSLTESPLTPKFNVEGAFGYVVVQQAIALGVSTSSLGVVFNVEGALGCVVVQLAIALGVSTSSLGVVFNIELGGQGGWEFYASAADILKRLQYFFLQQYPRGLSVGIRKATCQKQLQH